MKNKIIKLTQQQQGIISVLIFNLLLATNGIVTKSLSQDIPTPMIILIRLVFAMISLSVLSIPDLGMFKKIKSMKKKDVLNVVLLGILSSGLGFLFYTIGLRKAGVGISALLGGQETFFGIIFGALILKEQITKKQIFAFIGVFVGLVLLLSKNLSVEQSNYEILVGSFFSILSAICLGLGNVIAKIFLNKEISPVIIVFLRSLGGTITNLLFSIISGFEILNIISHINAVDWLRFIYIGMIFSGIGLLFQFMGIKRLKIKEFSVIYALYPIFSVFLGVMFMGEGYSTTQITGIILMIISSVVFINWQSN